MFSLQNWSPSWVLNAHHTIYFGTWPVGQIGPVEECQPRWYEKGKID